MAELPAKKSKRLMERQTKNPKKIKQSVCRPQRTTPTDNVVRQDSVPVYFTRTVNGASQDSVPVYLTRTENGASQDSVPVSNIPTPEASNLHISGTINTLSDSIDTFRQQGSAPSTSRGLQVETNSRDQWPDNLRSMVKECVQDIVPELVRELKEAIQHTTRESLGQDQVEQAVRAEEAVSQEQLEQEAMTEPELARVCNDDNLSLIQQLLEPTGQGVFAEISRYGKQQLFGPSPSMLNLKRISQGLLQASLASSTKQLYKVILRKYQNFVASYFPHTAAFPARLEQVILYISWSFSQDVAISTISTQISALAFVQRLLNGVDFTQNFLVKKLLRGYSAQAKVKDKRLPITPVVLEQIISALVSLNYSQFLVSLLKAMFLLAFYAFLRIGEFTKSPHNLQLSNIKPSVERKTITGYEIHMNHYKHKKNMYFPILQLKQKKSDLNCPVKALTNYLRLRPSAEGALFTFMDGSPIGRGFFTKHLRICLQAVGLDTSRYLSHSFRIGAATHAMAAGVSEEKIKKMGRWNSTAFQNYVRIPLLDL